LTTVDVQLGFSLGERPIDVIESHPGWYEITIVLSDDGFGVVLYVPKHPDTIRNYWRYVPAMLCRIKGAHAVIPAQHHPDRPPRRFFYA
jgi:hypothetical protein